MGFLDNLAIRRAERNLHPFMRPDERIIEYDIADLAQFGRNIPVVLTNRAIYFVAATSVRVPYEHVMNVEANGPLLVGIATKSGNSYVIQIVGTPKGDLYSSINHYLDRVIKHEEEVEVPNGSVRAICRREEEDGEPRWMFIIPEHFDITDREVWGAIKRKLGPTAQRLGVPLPPDPRRSDTT